MQHSADCVVIGGGLLGMLSARELAQAGLSVTLLEQGSLCRESSWAGGGIISPLVDGILGIEPAAAKRKLRVVPNLPATWDHVVLQQLRVGETYFDIEATRAGTTYRVVVQPSQFGQNTHADLSTDDYQLIVGIHLPEATTVVGVELNSAETEWNWEEHVRGHCLLCETVGQAALTVTVRL